MYLGDTSYRIIQTADESFAVERLVKEYRRAAGWRWWRTTPVLVWRPSALKGFGGCTYPQTFKTEAAAQKWIDDTRKYPLVVKEPA